MKKSKGKSKPLLIGITGGIGSGKTTVCRVFEWINIPVYYADDAAKRLIEKNQQVKSNIIALLGKKAYDKNGKYNRQFVGKKVFNSLELLQKLNDIVHPAVANDFTNWVGKNSDKPFLLKEAAILFESGSYKDCDKIICVVAPKKLRLNRVMERSGLSEKEVLQRMSSQWSDAKKIRHSDFIINNDEQSLLIPQVIKIHDSLLTQTRSSKS